jgi:hypothetical protein
MQKMVSIFRAELELCKISPIETVAVLSKGEKRADYVRALRGHQKLP